MDERLARWLLMTRDRLDGDDLPLTQPFLSYMLGANWPGVTLAVRSLAVASLVRHARGRITVLDRAGLETAAGGSYGARGAEYARLCSARRAEPRRGREKHTSPFRFRSTPINASRGAL